MALWFNLRVNATVVHTVAITRLEAEVTDERPMRYEVETWAVHDPQRTRVRTIIEHWYDDGALVLALIALRSLGLHETPLPSDAE